MSSLSWYWQKTSPSLKLPLSSAIPEHELQHVIRLTDQEDSSGQLNPRSPLKILQCATLQYTHDVENQGIFVEASLDERCQRELRMSASSRLLHSPLSRPIAADNPL